MARRRCTSHCRKCPRLWSNIMPSNAICAGLSGEPASGCGRTRNGTQVTTLGWWEAADGPVAAIGCSGDLSGVGPSGSPRRAAPFSPSATAPAGRSRSVSPPTPPSAASCSIPSSSSAKPTWTARCASRKAPSPTCSRWCSARRRTACRRAGRGRNGCCAISTAGCSSSTVPSRARRNVAHHYDLDGRLYSLFLDADRQYSCAYFEIAGPVARRRAACQEAPSRRQAAARRDGQRACSTSAAAGAGLRSISPSSAAPTSPASRCRRSNWRSRDRARGRSATSPARSSSACRTTATCDETFDRIVSVGMFEHVGARLLRRLLPQVRRAARRRRRDAAALDRPLRGAERHQSLDRQVHLPRRLHPGAVGGAAGDRARRACWSPTSRSCACTTPRRSRPGASASWRTARRPSGSTTSASCGCGSSISPPPKWRSASRP